MTGIKRIIDVQSEQEEDNSIDNIYNITPQDEALKIDNIAFSYDNNINIINNFSLDLDKNSFVALVGESGSGKSTIMKILMGFYTPNSGKIIFDGIDKTNLSAIRKKISYVPQDSMLINGTFYENIAFGDNSITLEDVENAAKLAGAYEFINNTKEGFEHALSDNGNNLSGGQKKRIAIARALVKKSDIILLDEVTSALDEDTSEQILKTLKNISKQKSVLFITHDKNIVKYADKVVNIC